MNNIIKQAISIVLITLLTISMLPLSTFATTAEESFPEITIGEAYSGLKDSNNEAILRFTLSKPANVKFKIKLFYDEISLDFDCRLYTIDEWSKQSLSDWVFAGATRYDDPTGTSSYSFSQALNSGEYILRLGSYPDTVKFRYKIYTSKTDGRESFPETGSKNDNSLKNANTIELNKNYYGYLASYSIDEYDIYKFTIEEDSELVFSLKYDIYGGYTILYNSAGKKLKTVKLGHEYMFEKTKEEIKKYQCSFDLKKGTYYLAMVHGGDIGMNYSFKIHKHTYNWERKIAPTCVDFGYDMYRCSDCGEVFCDENVPPTGKHNYTAITTPATITRDGAIETICTVCDDVSKTITINKVSSIKLSATSYIYDGNVKTPKVTIKDSKGKTLKNGTDYTLTYAPGRKTPGKYSVTVNLKGVYSGSKTLYFTILPGKTSKLTATQTASSVKATWKAVTGADGYKVTLYSAKNKAVKTIYTTKTSYTFSKLSKGTTYKVRVTAYKTIDGKKVYAGGYTQLTTATKPGTPSLTVSAGTKKASLRWNKQTGASGYVVYMATSKNGKFSKIATLKGNSKISFTKTGLTKGKTYYFKVAAYSTVSGKTLYGSYSLVKAVKVK